MAKTWRDIFKPEIDGWIQEGRDDERRIIYYESVQDGAMKIDYAAGKSGMSVADFADSMRNAGYRIPQTELA